MVMSWFRRHQKVLLLTVVAAMVTTMVLFGALSSLSKLAGQERGEIRYEIRGERIGQAELWAAGRDLQLAEQYMLLAWVAAWRPEFAQAGTQVDSFIFEGERRTSRARTRLITPDHIWRYLLLLKEAERARIQVTQAEMAGFAAENTDLQGVAANVTRMIKLCAHRMEAVRVTDPELWMAYAHWQHRARLRFVEFKPEAFAPLVEVEPEELEAFYEEHKDTETNRFRGTPGYGAPARVKMHYVLAALEDFEKQVEVSDEEIEQYYEENKADYLIPDGQPDASDQADQDEEQEAGESATDTEEGGSGDEGPPSDPQGENANQGDEEGLEAADEEQEAGESATDTEEGGSGGEGPLPDPQDENENQGDEEGPEAADEEQETEGEGAEQQEGEEGPRYRPLSEVKEDIRAQFLRTKSEEAALEPVRTMLEELSKQPPRYANEPLPLRQKARRHKLQYEEPATDEGDRLLSRRDVTMIVPGGYLIAQRIFDDEVDVNLRPVPTNKGPLAFEVLERRAPEPLPYEQVKDDVRADLIRRKTLERCEAEAEGLVEDARRTSIEEAVRQANERLKKEMAEARPQQDAPEDETKDAGGDETTDKALLEIRPTGLFRRSDFSIPAMRTSGRGVVEEAFRLEPGELAMVTESGFVPACHVIEKLEEQPADPEQFQKMRAPLRQYTLFERRQREAEAWMQGLLRTSPPPQEEEEQEQEQEEQ